MTGREQLNRRKRQIAAAVLAGVVLLFGGVVASRALGEAAIWVAGGAGLVVLMGSALAARGLALHCPWCRTGLGVFTNAGFWRLDPKLRYCPYCGADLDAEADGGGDWDDAN